MPTLPSFIPIGLAVWPVYKNVTNHLTNQLVTRESLTILFYR